MALIGAPATGKAAIVNAIATAYAHSSIRAGEVGEGKVYRTEFYWPDHSGSAEPLRVRLFGLSGAPVYHAVSQLVMAGADGLVFVANLTRREGEASRCAMRAFRLNAERNGLDLSTLPVVLHYRQPAISLECFTPDELDEWLGIAPGVVPRVVTAYGGQSDLRQGVEAVIGCLLAPQYARSRVAA